MIVVYSVTVLSYVKNPNLYFNPILNHTLNHIKSKVISSVHFFIINIDSMELCLDQSWMNEYLNLVSHI